MKHIKLFEDWLFEAEESKKVQELKKKLQGQITFLALKLLIDLLFYSGAGGVRRLWFTLLERAMIHGYAITEEY